jgi:hypothetical protein
MSTFADPGFVYHRTIAQVLGLIVAQVAELPVLSFRAKDYAIALDKYVDQVEAKLKSALSSAPSTSAISTLSDEEVFALRARQDVFRQEDPVSAATAKSFRKHLTRLHNAVAKLTGKAAALDEHAKSLEKEVEEGMPWWNLPKKMWLGWQIGKVNVKYKYLERSFLYPEGLDGRPWFKHVVFAPGLWTGYAGGKSCPLFSGLCHWAIVADTYLSQPSSRALSRVLMLQTGKMPRDGSRSSRAALNMPRSFCEFVSHVHNFGGTEYLGTTQPGRNNLLEPRNSGGTM